MLGLALGLAGCAAGSPAAVVPDRGEEQAAGPVAAAPELTPLADAATPTSDAPAGEAVSDAAAAAGPESAAGASQAPVVAAGTAAVTDVAADPTPPAGVAVVAIEQPTSAEPISATDPAAAVAEGTAQGAPAAADPAVAVADAHGVEAPAFAARPAAANVGAARAASAARTVAETTEPSAAAAQESARPPIPATDGSGTSQLIEGHADGRKEVALTFDAGSDVGNVTEILDLLRNEGITITFGMTGAFAEQYPDLVQRMVAEGHQLINHSYDHPSLTGVNTGAPPLTYDELASQLERTDQIVREVTGGYEMKPYFRPPYGDYDATTLGYLYDLGYPFTIMWTCDTQAWRGWDAAKILEYCTSVPLEDDIILMHVGSGAPGDYDVLPSMIDWYRDHGYAFVTIEQMMQP